MSSPNLPPELLDRVVDFLQDARDALKSCCLASKSWIPRTRKYLFTDVEFDTEEDVESWQITFQDPSTSPARYTKNLSVHCPWVATAADAHEGSWIWAFSCAVHLEMDLIDVDRDHPMEFLVPFHGFSPKIKSLRLLDIHSPLPPIFDLIQSFPLLEDLSVPAPAIPAIGTNDRQSTPVLHPCPPAFTGFLELCGVDLIATQLLSLPSSLHFRELYLTWEDEADISTTTSLVESCCSTLEFLYVNPTSLGESFLGPINLSKATKLKDITLMSCGLNPQWVVTTLQTITPSHKDLHQISLDPESILLHLYPDFPNSINLKQRIGDATFQGWSELDRTIVQLSESHSIRLKFQINYRILKSDDEAKGMMEKLLPEVTARGVANMDEWGDGLDP